MTREKTREGDVLQTLIGYQWIQAPMSLRLFFFTADRDGESVRVMSLHYKEV